MTISHGIKPIYRPQVCAPIYTTSCSDMLVYKLLSVTLAFLWSAPRVFCSYEEHPCTKPAVRREWRAFSTKEKAEWIRAVNVRKGSLILVVLLKHIRNLVLVTRPS